MAYHHTPQHDHHEWQPHHATRHAPLHAVRSDRTYGTRFDFDQLMGSPGPYVDHHISSARPYGRAGRRAASSPIPYATNDIRHNLSFANIANRTASSPLPDDTFEDFKGYMHSDYTRRISRAAVMSPPSLWRSDDMLYSSIQESHHAPNRLVRTELPPHMLDRRYVIVVSSCCTPAELV